MTVHGLKYKKYWTWGLPPIEGLALTGSYFLAIFLFFKYCINYIFRICSETLVIIIFEHSFDFEIDSNFSFNHYLFLSCQYYHLWKVQFQLSLGAFNIVIYGRLNSS